jgi:MFS family permease
LRGQGVPLTYLGEFRTHWRSLLAGVVGLSSGLSLITYIISLFAPYLLKEFGWSKADFALTGMSALTVLVCLPVAGRIADIFGVRRTAAIGVFSLPLTFLAFSAMTGPISQYIAIYIVQAIFGITTTTTVYSRLAAVPFTRARGLALSIVAASPAIVAAVFTSPLTRFIEAHGWRAGFQVIAAYMLVFGIVALLLIPKDAAATLAGKRAHRAAKQDYREILRNPVFWIILGALILCNFSLVLHASQLKLVLLAKGATSQMAATILSLYAVGVMVGRFASGLALDRFPAYFVAAVGLALPGIGMLLLASSLTAPEVLSVSLLMMGLALGAEGDVMGYLTVRYFGIGVYSSVLGMLTAATAMSFSFGSLVLSLTLRATESYSLFLIICAVAGLAGGGSFMLLRRYPAAQPAGSTETSDVHTTPNTRAERPQHAHPGA